MPETRGAKFLRPDRAILPDNPIEDYSLTVDAASYKIKEEVHGTATLTCDNMWWHKETVNHNLGYFPAFFLYVKDPTTNKWSVSEPSSGGLFATNLHIDENTIRVHIMWFMPGITAYCGGCPDYGDVNGPPSEELEIEYKYALIVDPLYEP